MERNGRIATLARRALGAALDFFFPRICPLCGGKSDRPGRHICWPCASALANDALHDGLCSICGCPLKTRSVDGLCPDCRRRRPPFDRARSALAYTDTARRLIHSYKYNGQIWLAGDFTDLLEGCVRDQFDPRQIDAVIPVPLHPAKFVIRNYNQSAILAARLARRLGVPCLRHALVRRRDTPTQTHLSPKNRKANMKDAFEVECPGAIASRTVLVLDDVMTTGATLGEIARTLKGAGAWRVWTVTLCRA